MISGFFRSPPAGTTPSRPPVSGRSSGDADVETSVCLLAGSSSLNYQGGRVLDASGPTVHKGIEQTSQTHIPWLRC